MGEKEDKEKAEKLAAAKKRVAQLQKKKKAAGGASGAGEKTTKHKSTPSKDDTPKSPTKDSADIEDEERAGDDDEKEDKEAAPTASVEEDQKKPEPVKSPAAETTKEEDPDEDEMAFNDVIKAATSQKPDDEDTIKSPESLTPPSTEQQEKERDTISSTKPRHSGRQASVSMQSKLRSTSFRDAAPGPVSPAGGSMPRVDELERENKRLVKEAEEHEGRWRKVEEELEELREETANKTSEEVDRLKAELETMKRQQRQSSVGGAAKSSRRESLATGLNGDDSDSLRKELESKESTISDMQLEISRLRSQLSSQTEGCETHGSQIAALQSSLTTAETKLKQTEIELTETKKHLNRASEKALLDGTERTSKDTKIHNLETEMASAIAQRDEVVKKAEQLEKKVEAMNKLHREAEARSSSKLSTAETSAREVPLLKARIEKLESENSRLREKHKRSMSGGGGDEGLDELEDEERKKLERKIRELEGTVFDLQRGHWREKRVAMQSNPGADDSRTSLDQVGEDFDDVDLTGSGATSRRRSLANTLSQQQQQQQPRHSGFAQVLNSGLAAFRTSTTSPDSSQKYNTRPRNDSLLEEFEDDMGGGDFDEAAFARAQREEEMKKMVEHVREVKKGLRNWAGWRLDLVDLRRGGGGIGIGEVFEV